MQNNRHYRDDEKQVKKIQEKYRQRLNHQLDQNHFPNYSAVKYNNQYENVLAGSEISLLDKMAETNDKVCDQTFYQGKDQNNILRLANSMKFSFNQNYQTQAKQDEKKIWIKDERNETIRDIYIKQFQKESQKIKEVQKARQQILNSIVQKKYTTNGQNKQNQFNSTSTKQPIVQNFNRKQPNLSKKLSFGLQSIQLPKNIIVEKKKQTNKQQEINSLQYLQDSLAKTKRIQYKPQEQVQKIHLTKKNYLQLSSNVKTQNANDSNISVKEFSEKEFIFNQILQQVFDRVDKCSIGKLHRNNCNYQNIEDLFKISFGSIFSRIKFKNLTLNKQQFVKIGMQIIKELHSQEFSTIIDRAIIFDHKRQPKYNEFYCQKCKNRISKLVSFSPEKSPYMNRQYQQNQQRGENYLKQQGQVRSQFSKSKSNHKEVKGKDKLLQQSSYKNDKEQKVNREKSRKSNPKLKKLIQQSDSYTKRQRKQIRNTGFIQPKKRRNISQSMLAQHKRNLQDLVVLNQKIENCLTISRKFSTQNHGMSQYFQLSQIPSYQFLQ